MYNFPYEMPCPATSLYHVLLQTCNTYSSFRVSELGGHVGFQTGSATKFLEQEGKTYIHTTVMGSCEANVDRLDANTGKMTTKSYQSEQRCLLEIKA